MLIGLTPSPLEAKTLSYALNAPAGQLRGLLLSLSGALKPTTSLIVESENIDYETVIQYLSRPLAQPHEFKRTSDGDLMLAQWRSISQSRLQAVQITRLGHERDLASRRADQVTTIEEAQHGLSWFRRYYLYG